MPYPERERSASGRASRASNMSAGSRSASLGPAPGGGRGSEPFSNAVMSMLRTTTETGDVGGLSFDCGNTMSNVPRAPPSRRSGATSRMSTGSNHSNASRRDSRQPSAHQHWPGAFPAQRPPPRNYGVPWVADTLSPTVTSIAASSPLMPRGDPRDSGRSRSMSHSRQHSVHLTNRSMANLRSSSQDYSQHQQYPQRDRSYMDGYTENLRQPPRASMRAPSPAMSDFTEAQHSRMRGGRGPPYARMRIDSDISLREPRRSGRRPPSRSSSPPRRCTPNVDRNIPPVPPIPARHQRKIAPSSRLPAQSTTASFSSDMPVLRTDSDLPSSDMPSSDGPFPPTPQAGQPISRVHGPFEIDGSRARGAKTVEVVSENFYLDGSEEFHEQTNYITAATDTFPPRRTFGLQSSTHGPRPMQVSRRPIVQTPKDGCKENTRSPQFQQPIKTAGSRLQKTPERREPQHQEIAELPASPVSSQKRRITRDIILKELGTRSSMVEASIRSTSCDSTVNSDRLLLPDKVARSALGSKSLAEDNNSDKINSTLSQPASVLLGSSTVDVAIKFSEPVTVGSPTTTNGTEDGMSDLLDGYDRTETRDFPSNIDTDVEPASTTDEEKAVRCVVEEQDRHSREHCSQSSARSCEKVRDSVCKDSGAQYHRTTMDSEALDSPPSSLETSASKVAEEKITSDAAAAAPALAAPSGVLRKKRPMAPRESSFAKVAARIRASPKHASKEGPTAASTPASKASRKPLPSKPPQVPSRNSSRSKEAQRSMGVSKFLSGWRGAKGPPSVRNNNSSRRASALSAHGIQGLQSLADKEKSVGNNIGASGDDIDTPSKIRPSDPDHGVFSSPERLPRRRESINRFQATNTGRIPSAQPEPVIGLPEALYTSTCKKVHHHSKSTPALTSPMASSVYSADNNISSSSKSRPLSTPPDAFQIATNAREDTQTTPQSRTPANSNASVLRVASGHESRFRSGQGNDESTTDLRMSGYKAPAQYLPDLKEELHEDSSLNTSISHVKNSSFGYAGHAVRSRGASVDQAAMFGRKSSVRSTRRNSMAQSQGLPSMNFSQVNLLSGLSGFSDSSSAKDGDTDSGRLPSDGDIRDKYKSVFRPFEYVEGGSAAVRLSGHRFLNASDVAAEVERVPVPSVQGLTQKLNDIIPSWKESTAQGSFAEEEKIMEHALEELQEVNKPMPKRSSARLRALPNSPNLVPISDYAWDSMKRNSSAEAHDSTSPSAGRGVDEGRARAKSMKVARAAEGNESQVPSPALRRARSLPLDAQSLRPSLDSRTSRSPYTALSTPTAAGTNTSERRPWNSDKNYPWAATSTPDISLPAQSAFSGARSRRSDGSFTLYTSREPQGPSAPAPATNNTAAAMYNSTRTGSQSQEAGDRYPTTSLSPPTNMSYQQLPSQVAGTEPDSDDEHVGARGRGVAGSVFSRGRFRQSKRSRVATGGADAEAVSAVLVSPGADEEASQNPRDAAVRARRETFRGAAGMPARQMRKEKVLQTFAGLWESMKKGVRHLRFPSKRQKRSVYPEPNNSNSAHPLMVNSAPAGVQGRSFI